MRLFTSRPDRIPATATFLSTAAWSLLTASLWPSVAVAEKTAADYFVHSLPGAPEGPLLKMHAGYDISSILSVAVC